jgi:hypothetical protein
MANERIFYACQAVGLKPMGSAIASYKVAHGVQSVGITTNFNLEQAFELGQVQIYENIEGLPDVECTMEKVLDGYPLLYHLASQSAASAGLVGRSKQRVDVALGIYSDEQDSVNDGISATTAPPVTVFMSGMFINSLSYTVPVDGNSSESVTLVGNHKEWFKTTDTGGQYASHKKFIVPANTFGTGDGSADFPKAYEGGSGGVQRRENVLLHKSVMPRSMFGNLDGNILGTEGVGNAITGAAVTGIPLLHIQNFSTSTDFGREDILEFGRKAPYTRTPTFPIEVSTEIEAIAISGDFIGAYEDGSPDLFATNASGDNTTEEQIVLTMKGGMAFDLGTNNRLSSVSYGGGDAAGGNATITYSYTNFNELTVLDSGDPALVQNGGGGSMNYSPTQSGFLGMTGG